MNLTIGTGNTYDMEGNLVEVEALGFLDEESGVFIVDPFTSSCGRFGFDLQQAMSGYCLTRDEVVRIVSNNFPLGVLDANPRYTPKSILTMCGLL